MVVFTADVYVKCSFAVQGLCVGAVVGGVSVDERECMCMSTSIHSGGGKYCAHCIEMLRVW